VKRPFGVLWVTGLPGSGKSTLAKAVQQSMQDIGQMPLLLDGDSLRDALNLRQPQSYQPENREQIAMSYARLCQLFANQGFLVICATVSMFHAVRTWNRENLPGYCEVFLDTETSILKSRDQKGLYTNSEAASILPEFPANPDVILRMHEPQDLMNGVNQCMDRWTQVLRS